MKPDDTVVILNSKEPYHIGIDGQILSIKNDEVKLQLITGKIVTYHPSCLRVIGETKNVKSNRTAKNCDD
jgi:hypothetical protein